jgi:SMODS-associating 2TM, beta-strand rich effector domain
VHPYSSSDAPRVKPIAYIAIGCFLLSLGLNHLIHRFAVSNYVGAPSALVLFGAFFWLFDSYLWKLGLFTVRLTPIPNLNGSWIGSIDVRRGKGDKEQYLGSHDCTVHIQQTWSRISITFETDATSSHSTMANLGASEDDLGGLRYEYSVKPKADGKPLAEEETVPHRGMARLNPAVGGDWETLGGDYYNDRHFQLWGSYHLQKLP